MTPLLCTQNSLFHIDYGTPLLASKSTDYRTSTGKNHDFMPSIPQHFDCRVKARIKPELQEQDITVRNEYRSTYNREYTEKHVEELSGGNSCALNCHSLDFIRPQQERIFRNPPAPTAPKVSEMKDSYPWHPLRPKRDVYHNYTCEIPEAFRAIQPDINPAQKGFHKFLDIYLTENRANYLPHTGGKLAKAQEDLITIYNANGKHKGLKDELPGKLIGNKPMYDTRTFKHERSCRLLSRASKRVPHSGMSTEYRQNFPQPACSEFYPFLQENGVYFPEALSKSGPWQDLCPPAMYCTENCHVGTGWPVRAVVDVNSRSEAKVLVHNELCCSKFEG